MTPPEIAAAGLFDPGPLAAGTETVQTLAEIGGTRIERIVSPPGYAGPAGLWYDQEWPEWVCVLSGEAGLLIEDEPEPRLLRAGASLLIEARQRHRVAWTTTDRPTIWLAVHLPPGPTSPDAPGRS